MPKVTPLVCHGPGFELGILVPSLHAYTVTPLYSAVVPYTVICCVSVILLQEERKSRGSPSTLAQAPTGLISITIA